MILGIPEKNLVSSYWEIKCPNLLSFYKLSLVCKVIFSWQLLSCFSILPILSPPIPPGELLLISWSFTKSQLYLCIMLCLSTNNPYDHGQRKGALLSSCLKWAATVDLQSSSRRTVRLYLAWRGFSTPRWDKNSFIIGKALLCPVFFRGHKTCEHHEKYDLESRDWWSVSYELRSSD